MSNTDAVMQPAIEAMEHGSSGMPQLDFSTYASQIFWLAVSMFVLYRLLSRSIIPKIEQTLEERHNAIAGDLDKAAELKRQADAANEAYDLALSEAKGKAETIASAEKMSVTHKIEEATAKADAEIAARMAESDKSIGEIRASAAQNVREVAGDAAHAILSRLLPDVADDNAARDAVASRLN